MSESGASCTLIRAGVVPLELVDREMRRLQEARIAGEVQDIVIFVEHPEVATLGRRARRDGAVVPPGYPTLAVDRGGGITWHGPGQLTVYPIIAWRLPGERSVARVIDRLEEWIIEALQLLGLDPGRDDRMHGVWLRGRKIASIGLSFQHWVTRHGFTINYATPPGRVEMLAGCGLSPETTTSIAAVTGRSFDRTDIEQSLRAAFPKVLGRAIDREIDAGGPPPWPV